MDDLIERFRGLDEVESPDVWGDATSRKPRPSRAPAGGRRILIAVFALGLAVAAVGFAFVALRVEHEPNDVIGSTPSPQVGVVMAAHEHLESLLGRLWTARAILSETQGEIAAIPDDIRALEAEIGSGPPTDEQEAQLLELRTVEAGLSEKVVERAALVSELEDEVASASAFLRSSMEEVDPAAFPDEATITCRGDGEGGTSLSTPIVRPRTDGVHLLVVNGFEDRVVFLDVGDGGPVYEAAGGDEIEVVLDDRSPRTLEIVCTYAMPEPTWDRPAHSLAVAL